jgi:penicillin-binding protein 1A
MRWLVRLAAAIALATATLAAGLGITLVGAQTVRAATVHRGLPDIDLRPLAQRSEILAADGSLLSALYEEDRVSVPLDKVPPVLVDAVLSVEDSSFYEHHGINVRGMLRAAKSNLSAGEVEQGGSTITQQLVKNSLLTSDRSYDRKAKEAVLAVRMEGELSKDEILQRYLNSVYFGQGAYGVSAAATRFFGKPVEQLTLPEAALLAGMISSPQSFDPVRQPERAKARRHHVLRRMVVEGRVSEADAAAADGAPLPTAVVRDEAQPSDHFTEEVRRQLLDDPRLGATPEERSATVFRGGIKVHTTLDPAVQTAAEAAVQQQLPPNADPFTAALVAIDPADGAVKALVGGPNFAAAKYDLATQGARQAGSSFKTIALAAWLAAGRSPEDLVDATAPCSFPTPGAPEPQWNVDNYEGGSGELLITTLREATVRSANCAYARVALALGPDKLVAMAKTLGISRPLPSVPSIVLGTGEVSPLEMASVYATLAADGVRHPPVFIRSVEARDGKVLLENKPAAEQVLDPNVARTVTDVLRGVVDHGTGRRANIGRPVAGKTGTSQEWRDAWFDGYTPQLAAVVWMGSPVGQESMRDVGGVHVTGGSYPAAIWSAFMSAVMAPLPVADFTPPDAALWPPNDWIGGQPGVLPPGFVLPPHLAERAAAEAAAAAAAAAATAVPAPAPAPAPPPPGPTADTTTTTTTAAPKSTTTTSSTTTTAKPPKRGK